MSDWTIHRTIGTQTTYARALDGLDRIMIYVDFDQWDDEDAPAVYHWSVQDGSCGKVLERGLVDGDKGLATARETADAAAARLFPGR